MTSELAADPLSTPRRRVLQWGVGAAAAAAGIGSAWWALRPHDEAAPALDAFWSLSFETPQGGALAMQSLRGRPLLVNFWATWCPPCVEELPLLNAFFGQHSAKGWQVVGLAVDQPSAVRKYLQRLPLAFPVGMAGLEGTELGKSLGNTAGGLPFSVVFGADGRMIERKMGQLHADDLARFASVA